MDVIDEILAREGGFVDHPSDRGGPTNWGITHDTLAQHRGRDVTVDEVRQLTRGEAREIYEATYINAPRFNQINYQPLRDLVIDCGVNHGTRRAARWLQQAAGVTDDGIVGPITLRAVNERNDGRELYRKLLAQRCRFFGQLITRDRAQAAFAAGWLDHRVAHFIESTP